MIPHQFASSIMQPWSQFSSLVWGIDLILTGLYTHCCVFVHMLHSKMFVATIQSLRWSTQDQPGARWWFSSKLNTKWLEQNQSLSFFIFFSSAPNIQSGLVTKWNAPRPWIHKVVCTKSHLWVNKLHSNQTISFIALTVSDWCVVYAIWSLLNPFETDPFRSAQSPHGSAAETQTHRSNFWCVKVFFTQHAVSVSLHLPPTGLWSASTHIGSLPFDSGSSFGLQVYFVCLTLHSRFWYVVFLPFFFCLLLSVIQPSWLHFVTI